MSVSSVLWIPDLRLLFDHQAAGTLVLDCRHGRLLLQNHRDSSFGWLAGQWLWQLEPWPGQDDFVLPVWFLGLDGRVHGYGSADGTGLS